MNICAKGSGCQPVRSAWSLERLHKEQADFRSNYLDKSTRATYQSGFNSYLSFCERHSLDSDPTPETLSFFIVYMAQQTGLSGRLISIRTISSYLSGVTHFLESSYPKVHDSRKDLMVTQTIRGAEKIVGQPIIRKLPIEDFHL